MSETKQPWDDVCQMSSTASTTSPDILQQTQSLGVNTITKMETVAGTESVKYGLGKPVRTSIIGDLKHGLDQ